MGNAPYFAFARTRNNFVCASSLSSVNSKVSVSFRKTESVEVTPDGLENLKAMRDDLLKYKEPEPDKTAIKQALKSGLSVRGVRLVQNTSTIIK